MKPAAFSVQTTFFAPKKPVNFFSHQFTTKSQLPSSTSMPVSKPSIDPAMETRLRFRKMTDDLEKAGKEFLSAAKKFESYLYEEEDIEAYSPRK